MGVDSTRSAPSHARLKSRLRDFWNAQTVYWEHLSEEVAVNSDNRSRAASYIPEGSRILDVACGRAANCVWALGRGEYFGVDISMRGLQRAERTGLQLFCADAEALPFQDRSFDVVLSTYALEHSVDPAQMLSEMTRVTQQGGRIILLGPSWDFPFWYPNSLSTRAHKPLWRLRYSAKRLATQMAACIGAKSPFLIVEDPDAFSQPFEDDVDAVYVVWNFEVIREMKRFGCKLLYANSDDQLLGSNPVVRLVKQFLMLFPAYRHAGSTCLMVFER